MDNLCHVFNGMKMPNQASIGQTVFYDSTLRKSSDEFYGSETVNADVKDEEEDSSGPHSEKLRQVYSVCSAYTEELSYLCHTGLRMAKFLEEHFSQNTESTPGNSNAQEMAGHFVNVWNHLSVKTKKLVSNFEEGVLATLRDAAMMNNHSDKNSTDTNNIFMACFLSIIQIHYQFSVSMFESIVQLLSSIPGEMKLSSFPCKTFDDSLKEPFDLMSLWIDSLSEMQKHLFNLRLHFNQYLGSKITNDLSSISGSSVNQPSRRRWSFGGLRQNYTPNDWPIKYWPIPGQQFEMDSSHAQSLWHSDEDTGVPQPSDDPQPQPFDMSVKRGSTDSQKSSTFASNEELEDVITLLSCQPSNPSSPTSDAPYTLSSNNGQPNFLWSTSQYPAPSAFEKIDNGKQATSNYLEEFGTWNKGDGSQPYIGLRMQSLFEGNIAEHQPAIKSTSWPAGATNQQLRCFLKHADTLNPSNFPGLTNSGKEAGFFMGLELSGNDLMATVRQRRHSSGESLCKSNRAMNPSSIRTKSIDDMIAEGKCPRTSTWPPKQFSPNLSLGYPFAKSDSLTKPANWSSVDDYPQGLPPSGFDGRNKSKSEKKYSLFGNPT